MRKKVAGILSIILAFSLIFSLAACGKKDEKETTTTDNTTLVDEPTVFGETTADQSDETTDPFAESTDPSDETTNTSDETPLTTGATTANPSSAPRTAAEIVAYYNTAANKAKKEKPAYTLTTTNVIGAITSPNSLIEGLAKQITPLFPTDPLPTVSVKKGDGSTLPVVGQSYGGKVEVSSLKNKGGAVCIDKGSYYEITLNFKDEKLNSLPTDVTKVRHGQAFNLLTQKLVDDELVKFKALVTLPKFAPTYNGCYVKCKIEKSTGNILSATYYCVNNSDVEAKLKVGNPIKANIHFGNKEEFVFSY